MLRFVRAPDGRIVPDIAATLPGRGFWLSARGDVIETARVRGAFARAARGQVSVPPDLRAMVDAALVRRIGELLGLARRAGQAVAGFQKAREWLEAGRVGLVVQAADGSAAECQRFLSGAAGQVPVATPLPAAALGAVFGREQAVHVAVAAGRLAVLLRQECDRLAGVRGPGGTADERASGLGAARLGPDGLNERAGA
jgi:hypothetical protein